MADRFARGNTDAGDTYAPVPQLTLEAAQNYAAFDAAQAKQVVDRQAYWQEQRRLQEEEAKRQQMLAQQRAEQQQMQLEAQQMEARLRPLTNEGLSGALGRIAARDQQGNVTGLDPVIGGVAQQGLAGELQRQNALVPRANAAAPLTPAVLSPEQQAQIDRFGRLLTPTEAAEWRRGFRGNGDPTIGFQNRVADFARTEIPYAGRVAGAVGDAAGAIAKASPQLGLANAITERTPLGNMFGKDTTTSNLAATAAESLVPTEVWQAALTLLPAAKARSIPELLSAITLGDTDALTAMRNAGKKLSVDVEPALKMLQGERGALTLGPGEDAAKAAAGAGDAAGLQAADNFPSPPKRSPAFDAEGRPIEMKSGEPYAQFDELGNAIDPATKELLPPANLGGRAPSVADEAALQITEWLRVGEKVRPEQKTMFAKQRGERAAKMEAVYARGGTSAEAMAEAGGKFDRPFLAPLKMTPEGEYALRTEIRQSSIMGFPANKASAERAIDAMNAGVLPQPEHAIQLSKIIGGPDFLLMLERRAPREWKKEFIGVLGVPQALQSGLDASAIFRQMAPLGFGNPAEYIDAIGTIGRAAHSWESAKLVQAETEALPWITSAPFPEAEALGINFRNLGGRMADIGGHLHEGEGQFSALNRSVASKAVEAIPGYQLSERIYNVPINRERGLVFSKFAQNMWDAGERNPDRFKALADVVDHASGWSNLTPGQIADGLNAFYSVRNLAARFQVLLDPILQPGSLLKPSARQLAARNLVGFVSANAAMLGMMAGGGALAAKTLGIPNPVHVELDPRSGGSFTGKIGNMRIDMTGGYGSIIRLVARLAPLARGNAPQIKSPGGLIQDASPAQLVDDFIAGKLGPVPKVVWNALGFPGGEAFAEDFRSKKGLRTAAFNLMTPFFVQDVVEAWRQEGAKSALIAAPVSFLGGSVSTYEQSASSVKKDAKSKAVGALQQAGVPFSGNEIDFRQPALDAKVGDTTTRQALIDQFGLKDVAGDASLADISTAYVDGRVKGYMAAQKVSEVQARDALESNFQKIPKIATIIKNAKSGAINYWRAHPALLKQALEAGKTDPSAEKWRIVADANLPK